MSDTASVDCHSHDSGHSNWSLQGHDGNDVDGWVQCSCICGPAGQKVINVQLTPDASIGQIHARLKEVQGTQMDPKIFNKIVLLGSDLI